MREIKFRRAVFLDGAFVAFKYWGKHFAGAPFVSPGHEPGHDQQFIGLKDKNGKDVYEGDIVQTYMAGRRGLKFEIRYEGKSFVMWQEGDTSAMDCVWYFDFEVIGNIFKNPELLTT